MTDPMRCSHCASEVPPGSALCPSCTAPLFPSLSGDAGAAPIDPIVIEESPAAAAIPGAAASCGICGAAYGPEIRFCTADGATAGHGGRALPRAGHQAGSPPLCP